MDWHTRITQARSAKGLGKSELARLVGVSPATITMWESGQTKKIDGTNLIRVCTALDINPMWLLGKLDGDENDKTSMAEAVSRSPSYNGTDILVIDVVRFHSDGGTPYFEVEPAYEDGTPSKMGVRRQWASKHLINWKMLSAVKVEDASMEPTLCDGDLIAVNRADKEPIDGAVYLMKYEFDILIRRFVRDSGKWWLVADHVDQRRFGRKVFTGEEGEIIGRVVLRETSQV